MGEKTVVRLADGCCVVSGGGVFTAGDYVQIISKEGRELGYWHQDEWRDEPELVMGAILRMMAGKRIRKREKF